MHYVGDKREIGWYDRVNFVPQVKLIQSASKPAKPDYRISSGKERMLNPEIAKLHFVAPVGIFALPAALLLLGCTVVFAGDTVMQMHALRALLLFSVAPVVISYGMGSWAVSNIDPVPSHGAFLGFMVGTGTAVIWACFYIIYDRLGWLNSPERNVALADAPPAAADAVGLAMFAAGALLYIGFEIAAGVKLAQLKKQAELEEMTATPDGRLTH